MCFCIYIGRKWFGLVFGIWFVKLVKVLIFFGFDDIGYDIGVWGDVLSIKHKKYRFFFVILRFFSWCVDKPT